MALFFKTRFHKTEKCTCYTAQLDARPQRECTRGLGSQIREEAPQPLQTSPGADCVLAWSPEVVLPGLVLGTKGILGNPAPWAQRHTCGRILSAVVEGILLYECAQWIHSTPACHSCCFHLGNSE